MIIQTRTGKLFDVARPAPSTIDLRDIASGLAKTNRFGGHTFEPYSVAQHSVILADQVPAEDRLWALLHDAAEAYIGDIPKPIKEWVPDFQALEDNVLEVITTKYGLDGPMPASVKEADIRMLLTEARDLMHDEGAFDRWGEGLEPYDFSLEAWNWWDAQTRWFQAVTKELK